MRFVIPLLFILLILLVLNGHDTNNCQNMTDYIMVKIASPALNAGIETEVSTEGDYLIDEKDVNADCSSQSQTLELLAQPVNAGVDSIVTKNILVEIDSN